MSRTQTFDRTDVIRAARTRFWRRGFDAASIPELEEATGLSRSSLYNTFGSKRGLFDEVVENYLDEVIRPRLEPLIAPDVSPTALRDYLLGLRTAFESRGSLPAEHGCLLVKTAASPVAEDAAVSQVIADYRSELGSAIGRGVDAALPSTPPAARAQCRDAITALVIAAFALAPVDPAQSIASIDSALGFLPA